MHFRQDIIFYRYLYNDSIYVIRIVLFLSFPFNYFTIIVIFAIHSVGHHNL